MIQLVSFFQMSCLERRFRRTAPTHGGSRNELVTAPLHSRVNGWSLPLHVLQLVAWLMYSFLAIGGFGVYIPLLPPPWNYIAYGTARRRSVIGHSREHPSNALEFRGGALHHQCIPRSALDLVMPESRRPETTGLNPTGLNPSRPDAFLNPTGLNPTGQNPTGLNPTGLKPSRPDAFLNPTGLNPTGLNPTGLNPTGQNPTGLKPSRPDAFLNPTGLNPTGLNPTGLNPTGLNPTGLNPTGLNPTGLNPAGLNPTGLKPSRPDAFLNPTGLNPTGLNPTGLNRACLSPAGINPTVIGTAFVLHLLTHLAAVTVDPADHNVRLKKDYSSPMPVFDKKKQRSALHPLLSTANLIPNLVYSFLRLFFLTVLSAVFGVFLLVVVILFVFIEHFVSPTTLRTAAAFQSECPFKTCRGNLGRGWPSCPWLPCADTALLASSSCVRPSPNHSSVALASLLLLCHLLVFHIYLLCKGMSTYEYIVTNEHSATKLQRSGGRRHTAEPNYHWSPAFPTPRRLPQEKQKRCFIPLCSIFKYQDRRAMSSGLSGPICSEMEHFPQAADGDSNPDYGSKASTQIIPGEAPDGWCPPSHVESTQVLQQRSSSQHSEGHPIVQSPLGTSIIDTTVVHQQLIH
ncbi:hypothetical protein NFI96_029100 [Prochilodus magdalenae]|nr:hypothetical protein NFI96_029100 [Prochilodus magdalenae]